MVAMASDLPELIDSFLLGVRAGLGSCTALFNNAGARESPPAKFPDESPGIFLRKRFRLGAIVCALNLTLVFFTNEAVGV
jgi:hypothetical protein